MARGEPAALLLQRCRKGPERQEMAGCGMTADGPAQDIAMMDTPAKWSFCFESLGFFFCLTWMKCSVAIKAMGNPRTYHFEIHSMLDGWIGDGNQTWQWESQILGKRLENKDLCVCEFPVSSGTTYLQDGSGKGEDVLSPERGRRQAAIARQSNNGIQASGKPTNPTNN